MLVVSEWLELGYTDVDGLMEIHVPTSRIREMEPRHVDDLYEEFRISEYFGVTYSQVLRASFSSSDVKCTLLDSVGII